MCLWLSFGTCGVPINQNKHETSFGILFQFPTLAMQVHGKKSATWWWWKTCKGFSFVLIRNLRRNWRQLQFGVPHAAGANDTHTHTSIDRQRHAHTHSCNWSPKPVKQAALRAEAEVAPEWGRTYSKQRCSRGTGRGSDGGSFRQRLVRCCSCISTKLEWTNTHTHTWLMYVSVCVFACRTVTRLEQVFVKIKNYSVIYLLLINLLALVYIMQGK